MIEMSITTAKYIEGVIYACLIDAQSIRWAVSLLAGFDTNELRGALDDCRTHYERINPQRFTELEQALGLR